MRAVKLSFHSVENEVRQTAIHDWLVVIGTSNAEALDVGRAARIAAGAT
jgi:hypothetical protein